MGKSVHFKSVKDGASMLIVVRAVLKIVKIGVELKVVMFKSFYT